MKKYLFVLALFASSAYAAPAFLVSCSTGYGPNGGPAWVGTYNVNGRNMVMYFPMQGLSYCPPQVEVP